MTSDVYTTLGVRKVVNAAATLTVLGGCPLPDEVVDAMASAAASCVDIRELHQRAGELLAKMTNNEAAYVTNGCASGIVLAVLACITRGEPARIARLPFDQELPCKVVMHRAHRIPYDRAVELAGGHIVEIGNMFQTFGWELEAAINLQTAAVLWVAGSHLPQAGALELAQTVEIAHARGVPVIVDAAAQLPPATNLWRLTAELGADLALFSGGKALCGPQSSGLMVGNAELVEAAAANASPNQRLARALKVGKEEICGLVAAVRRYLALDHEAMSRNWEAVIADWTERLAPLSGVTARRAFPNEAGQPVPRLQIVIHERMAGITADELIAHLWDRDPRVAVLKGQDETVYVTPDTLVDQHEQGLVIDAIFGVLAGVSPGNRPG